MPEETPTDDPAAASDPSPYSRDAAFGNLDDLPGHLWETFGSVLEDARDIRLVATVVGVQFAVSLLQYIPDRFFKPDVLVETNGTTARRWISTFVDWGGVVGGQLAIAFAANVLLFSLYRPIRTMHFEGTGAVVDLRDAFASGAQRMLPVAGVVAVWGLLAVVGFVFCLLPGILVVSISWLPVYIAATTDRGVAGSIRSSWELFERQWKPIVLIAVVQSVAFSFVSSPDRIVPCLVALPCMFDALWSGLVYGLFWFFGPSVMLVLEERDRAIHESRIWPAPSSHSGSELHTGSESASSGADSPPPDPDESVDDSSRNSGSDPFESEEADVEW